MLKKSGKYVTLKIGNSSQKYNTKLYTNIYMLTICAWNNNTNILIT